MISDVDAGSGDGRGPGGDIERRGEAVVVRVCGGQVVARCRRVKREASGELRYRNRATINGCRDPSRCCCVCQRPAAGAAQRAGKGIEELDDYFAGIVWVLSGVEEINVERRAAQIDTCCIRREIDYSMAGSSANSAGS